MRPYACALQADQDFLQELFGKWAVAGSRFYNAAMHGLQLLALTNKPKHWAASIRDGLSESKAFKKWRKNPKDTEKTVNALAQLMLEAVQTRTAKNQNSNDAAAALGGGRKCILYAYICTHIQDSRCVSIYYICVHQLSSIFAFPGHLS